MTQLKNRKYVEWSLCSCGHIAQAHASEEQILKGEKPCSESQRGNCPTCGQYSNRSPCQCKGYDAHLMERVLQEGGIYVWVKASEETILELMGGKK